MEQLISITKYPVKVALKLLLADKTTKENIVFATDSYSDLGDSYQAECHIDKDLLLGMKLQPRVLKDKEEQTNRTKDKAEVMTPAWVVNKMNNHCDEDWFGYKNVFNTEQENDWKETKKHIRFPKDKTWQDYVNSMRLEITCGEAPYLVSRYDTTTGDIIPVEHRIGVIDRKLRVVNENTTTKEEWLEWVIHAYESTYGYEYQGDNLLIGRINMLNTFVDYMDYKWGEQPDDDQIRKIANIIAWNLWQMDGLNGCVPYAYTEVKVKKQLSFFDFDEDTEDEYEQVPTPARIYNWRSNKSFPYNKMKEN